MKRINSLSDLLMEELADLLNAETQLVEALPKMTQASESAGLKSALGEYLKITKEHIKRLQVIFSNIGQHPQKLACKAMKAFITETEEVVSKTEKSLAHDVDIISVVQRLEQHEIVMYKRAREHAADLGHTRIVELFTKTLNDHRAMNFYLNELAQGMINVQATEPAGPHQQKENDPPKNESGGFYILEGRFHRGGIKKKPKDTDVSRFIGEGNPNTEDPRGNGEEKI